jgi:hypothetical protein
VVDLPISPLFLTQFICSFLQLSHCLLFDRHYSDNFLASTTKVYFCSLLQPLECLYLDCTYGDKVFDFPTKEEAIRQVCDFIACQTEDTQQVYLACDQLGMEEVRLLHGLCQLSEFIPSFSFCRVGLLSAEILQTLGFLILGLSLSTELRSWYWLNLWVCLLST